MVVKDRNGIKLIIKDSNEFYGPKKKYIVHLYEGSMLKVTNITEKRLVVFEHLSYLTNYRVEVGIGRPRIIPSLNQCFQRFSFPPGNLF